MYLRMTLAAIIAVVLAGTHWKAYVSGGNAVRQQEQARALAASEEARQREHALATNVEKLDHELQRQKARNAALSRAHTERLREYQAALDRAASKDAATPSGAVEPFAAIAGECGRALTALDGYARDVAARAGALQEYASRVCVKP